MELDPITKKSTVWIVSYKHEETRLFVFADHFTRETISKHGYVTSFGRVHKVVNITAGTCVLDDAFRMVFFGWTEGGAVFGGIDKLKAPLAFPKVRANKFVSRLHKGK